MVRVHVPLGPSTRRRGLLFFRLPAKRVVMQNGEQTVISIGVGVRQR